MPLIRLTSEQAHLFFGVPIDTASAKENTFFGEFPADSREYFDGQLPFLACIGHEEKPNIATIYINTIEPEFWETNGQIANPFLVEGGYIHLDKLGWEQVITFLSTTLKQLPKTSDSPHQMFQGLSSQAQIDLHIRFPEHLKKVYLQTFDPLEGGTQVITLVKFSEMFLKIMQFSRGAMSPEDHSLARINLDQNGMKEFILLLQKHFVNQED
jgi:hypothetical protein